jgi:RimJ/RimL family protein N-acetyltransferase
MITIKNFTATDKEFKELARIDNLVNHDSIAHPDEDKNEWNIRDKSLIRNRLLLYDNNILIGVMYYSQGRDENNKTAFFTLHLDPNYNNNGYRKLLYDKMLERVEIFSCNKVHTSIYDHPNYEEIKKLIIKEKFKLVQTNREYSCDLKKINIDKYQPLIKKLESEGIRFHDSKEDMLNWPNHYKKLEELEWKIEQDVPIPDGIKHTRLPFKHWKKLCLDFYKNSYGVDLVATIDNKYIGATDIFVFGKSEPQKGWTGSLGVLKEFRRKGIATAIKIKAIEILLNKGITELRTDNEENNPMYKINVNLGFKPVPFSLDYLKEI